MRMVQFEIASGHHAGREMWVNPAHVSSVDGDAGGLASYITFVHGRTVEVRGGVARVTGRLCGGAG